MKYLWRQTKEMWTYVIAQNSLLQIVTHSTPEHTTQKSFVIMKKDASSYFSQNP